MKRWALIKAGVVETVVEQDEQPSSFEAGDDWRDVTGLHVGPGMLVDEEGVYSDPPPPVPTVLSKRQACLALYDFDMLDAVNAAIDALPEPERSRARVEWDTATEVWRDNALVVALAPAIGLDLDELFAYGSTL